MPISTITNGESGADARVSLNQAITAVNGLGDSSTKNVGSTAGTVCAGDDSRLSNARTPTAHAATHTNGTDDIQDATASQKGLATATQITKLDGIEALADVTDATNVGSSIGGATVITTIGDTDQLPVVQTNALKSITYASLKTLLSAIYQAASAKLTAFAGLANSSGVLANDGSGNLSWQTPGGAGDVVGPTSATDNALARFDTTTGKLIQNSGITVADGATGVLSGTNTGDQTIALTGDVTGSGTGSFAATLATVNSNVGSFGSATASAAVTVNAKGLVTAASASTITPAVGSITGLGTGVATALAVNIDTAGAPVVNGGALATPSSGTLTNCTGLPTGGLVDDAVTLAKMAAGTAGNLITYDASGNPAAVATGTAGQVLTSNGAGAAPTMQTPSGGGGAVLAVKVAIKTDTQSLASATWTDITSLSITYSPTSSSNNILVVAQVQGGASIASCSAAFRLVRDSTPIGIADAAGSRIQASAVSYPAADGQMVTAAMSVLDSPATTSSTVYKVQFRRFFDTGSGTVYVNRPNTDTDANNYARCASTITIYEVTP
jgi:hypothetical protein